MEITSELVRYLLRRPESATLDFKQCMYPIKDKHHEAFLIQRDELIKDVLALANNNATYAGEWAYLVLGASDDLNADGKRTLFEVGADFVEGETIRQIVNAACMPAIHEIVAATIEVEQKQLIIIGIPPTRFVHETSRHLLPGSAKHGYSERTVFIRHGSNIRVASWQECDAIAKVKRLRHEEWKNPPATPFGGIVGAVVGGAIVASLGKKVTGGAPGSEVAGAIVGTVLGGGLGAGIGHNYGNLIDIRSAWPSMSKAWRLAIFAIPSLVTLVVVWLLEWIKGARKSSSNSQAPK